MLRYYFGPKNIQLNYNNVINNSKDSQKFMLQKVFQWHNMAGSN